MERINIPASIQNLTNVDKLQQKIHSNPVVHSQQNSEIDDKRNETQLTTATEVDEAENQVIDPDEKKEKREKKKKGQKKKLDKENRGRDSGKFIDYSV